MKQQKLIKSDFSSKGILPKQKKVDMNYIWNSLIGFYKPEYDKLTSEEIYDLYVKRKEYLSTYKSGKKPKKTDIEVETQLLNFALKNKYMIVGIFFDKQSKRGINN